VLRRDPLADPEALLRRVYSYVAYRIGPGPDAEDVTSEAYARALRARETYDPSRGAPLAWLIGIARRCLAEAMAARPLLTLELPEPADSGDLEERTVRRLALAAAVASLDEREQELIALRYGADLSARRIGEILGLRTNAVEVALHRALVRLRDRLEAGRKGLPLRGRNADEGSAHTTGRSGDETLAEGQGAAASRGGPARVTTRGADRVHPEPRRRRA
jgi:RNA polymerase sigma-70 factor, ECF subfamily